MEPWSVQNEILKQVNREAEWEWAAQNNTPELPKFYYQKVKRDSVGWLNFTLTTLKELRP